MEDVTSTTWKIGSGLIDISATFQGVSSPLRELIDEVHARGWDLTKVDIKDGQYVAAVKNPHGEIIEKTGPDPNTAVGNCLIALMRQETIRYRQAAWDHTWEDKLPEIAQAYADANAYDPKAASAWKELAQDSEARAKAIANQIRVEMTHDPHPYKDVNEMADDIRNKQKIQVSRANTSHPLWTEDQMLAYRLVHDVLGHAQVGGDWGWHGENGACFTGDTLVRTERGYQPISTIKVGDRVLTASGEFQAVYATSERSYSGPLYEIETNSTFGKIRVTPNHPFMKLIGNHRSDKSSDCQPAHCNGDSKHLTDWIEASDLKEKDWLRLTVPNQIKDITTIIVPEEFRGRKAACLDCQKRRIKCTHKESYVSRGPLEFDITDDFLWAIGLYLAEGSSGENKLVYTLHREETEYQDRLVAYFSSLGYKVNVVSHGPNGCEVKINSAILCRWWPAWLGRGCQNKHIPEDLIRLPESKIKPLIEGIMNGDGTESCHNIGQTSMILALQLIEMAIRIGYAPTASEYAPPKDHWRQKYVVHEVNSRYDRTWVKHKKGTWNIDSLGTFRQIKKINQVDFEGKVYNLSVEKDPTYIVQNITVHNCAAHMPLLSPEAQRALFTEAIGQAAHNHFYRTVGPQKIVFLDDHLQNVQDAEGAARGHGGVHPSQTIVPTGIPEIPMEGEESGEKTASIGDSSVLDPNDGWASGIEPLPDNAYLWQREDSGLDPLDHAGVKDMVHKINPNWFELQDHNGIPDLDSQRQAVVNAFRSTLLQPRQTPRWGATHYQHIQHIPATVSDPLRFTDALDTQREAHNKARGLPEGVHRAIFDQEFGSLKGWIKGSNPSLDDAQVDEIARRELFHMIAEEEERVTGEDPGGQLLPMEIADIVGKDIKKRLAVMTKPSVDQKFDFGKDRLFHKSFNAPDPGIYGDFLNSHVKSVAGVGLHADDIARAAREDVANHGGKGHHFRAQVSDLIPGVGPREISHAWMLLQPHTSQLGVISPSVAETLGYDPEKEIHPRDYYKMERQLAAGRDASGYQHVPLGQFSWGMYDRANYGHGIHRDLSPFAAVNPTPYDQVDWTQYPGLRTQEWDDPYWWNSTEPNRDEVGQQFDQMVAVKHPKHEIPYRTAASSGEDFIPAQPNLTNGQWGLPDSAKGVLRTPFIMHPESGEMIVGEPGQTAMQHAKNTLGGLTTEQIWAMDPEVGKH